MSDPIREGDLVIVRRDGRTRLAIADGGPENGEIWVRFTTRGKEQPIPAKYVTKARTE